MVSRWRGRNARTRQRLADCRGGRIRVPRRPERVWEINVAQYDRGPRIRGSGRDHDGGPDGYEPRSGPDGDVPGSGAFPVAERTWERALRAEAEAQLEQQGAR